MTCFKDSSDADGKWFVALVAFVKAKPSCLALHFADALEAATMRTSRTILLYARLDENEGCDFVMEMFGRKNGFHG